MYKVVETFTDLQDGNHLYSKGDTYPREGYEPSEERAAELAGSKNIQHRPLIREIVVKARKKAEEKAEE